ncbi:HNH endonuclease signature motif containing protein [Nocardioides marmorisolisilvae]|uniref:HNH endonuclease n=1 Tax=Nocardioides marmorisolisilvae TaxID=1542737 RepID=A0A3N0DSS6_9ACTN|nr:HNH endonuclease signature motif containing protein [Nocardioides marmorisolisilvae]RNL78660.1 HNH endonuclease [Nocardioides marmorisolisilvae]
MSIQHLPDRRHPVLSMLDELEAVRAKYAGAPVWTMSVTELSEAVPRLATHNTAMRALGLTVLREADRQQVGDPNGYANTLGWYAAATHLAKPEAKRDLRLAEYLDDDGHQAVRAAALDGAVTVDQAGAIIAAVEDLPTDLVDPGLRTKAENHLIEFAADLDPKQLRIIGRRILEVEAPEIADAALARVLEAEEAHAEATSSFSMRPDGHGSMVGRFKIPLLAGRMLERHLAAIAAPRHQNAMAALDPTGTTVTKPWRWGAAFTEYIETRPASSVPRVGGIAATVVVTMPLETLLGDLKAAGQLDTGETISAAAARRLACEAGIIPAVLGTRSQVLDLGRKTRFHTEPQRIAIALRDKTCIIEGCDRGPQDAHVHHLDQWAHGGGTSVERGVMICAPHHTQIHDPRYTTEPRPGGKLRFHRRT